MIWMSGIILFFFLLAILLIIRFYHSIDQTLKDTSSVAIKNREAMIRDLNEAATKYMNYNYDDFSDVGDIKLTSEKLFKSGLFPKDLYGDCTGYAMASKINDQIFTRSYVKCSDFKSAGYDNN